MIPVGNAFIISIVIFLLVIPCFKLQTIKNNKFIQNYIEPSTTHAIASVVCEFRSRTNYIYFENEVDQDFVNTFFDRANHICKTPKVFIIYRQVIYTIVIIILSYYDSIITKDSLPLLTALLI